MSIGIYVHIPFCATKCSYCHFFTHPFESDLAQRYCLAVVREMELFFKKTPWDKEVDSIYFGGGTPSMAPSSGIEAILSACRSMLPVARDCEITLEANPESVTAATVAAYRQMGINRISIGAQSFEDQRLQLIGRNHCAHQVLESVKLFREHGIDNLNLDLMLGLPGQNDEELCSDLACLCAQVPSHISVYMLDLDEQVPLYHLLKKGRCRIPEEDTLSDWYLRTLDYLSAQGYEQYEISNFARLGRQSLHNLKYWRREIVLGFGTASHSFDGNSRFANLANLNAYLRSVDQGHAPVEWRQNVPPSQALQETLFLGLRLNEGVDWNTLGSGRNASELAPYEESLHEMSRHGLVKWQGSVVRLTPQGMLLSNEVFQAFV